MTSLRVITSAKMKSFQAKTNVNTAVAKSPLRTIGKTTLSSAPQRVQPSTSALSSSSSGTSSM